jgi:hypothetical protein
MPGITHADYGDWLFSPYSDGEEESEEESEEEQSSDMSHVSACS